MLPDLAGQPRRAFRCPVARRGDRGLEPGPGAASQHGQRDPAAGKRSNRRATAPALTPLTGLTSTPSPCPGLAPGVGQQRLLWMQAHSGSAHCLRCTVGVCKLGARQPQAPGLTPTCEAGPIMEPGSVENLSIVYRSSDFLVVNKHWDLRIDSKTWRETLTLQKQLRHRFPELADPDTCYGFRFCHQLDFSTSGALCVALNKAAAGSAYRCFKERRVTKAYLALVRGHVQENQVTISHAIGKNSTEGRTHTMCIEGTQGCENPKPSLTKLVVLEHGLYAGNPVSKVLLKPLTGRTHQLRVHCSALGHPIVGDLTYGQAEGQEDQPFRMMLHAFYLRIPTQVECVEACTPDPFLPTLDTCWSPHTLVQPLDQLVQALQADPDPDPMDSGPGPCSPSTLLPGPGRLLPETEAQRASCLQWLSEWTLEPDN